MSVGPTEARRIATLAHLELDDRELDRMRGELNRILEHVVALEGLELTDLSDIGMSTEGVSPVRSPEADEPDELARGPGETAPDWRDGFFVVPALPGLSDGTGEEDPS